MAPKNLVKAINRLIGSLLCMALSLRPVTAKYNISMAQLATCESYIIEPPGGYAYKDFFMVKSMDNNNIVDNNRLHLRFYVQTSMDAHILLAVTNRPRANDRVYEIVIGAGGNTFSAIRTSMGSRRVSTNQDVKLLSVYEQVPIEIVQTKDGDLFVYIPGHKEEPLLQYKDPAPLMINYLSFSTFGNTGARWYYDCAFDGSAHEMEQQMREKTVDEKLLSALNQQAENSSLPSTLSEIQFNFQMQSLGYDQSKALLRTRMELMLRWHDPRLTWQPETYGNMKSFVHPRLKLWTPHLVVLNAAFDSLGEAIKSFDLRVNSNGNVTLMANNLELATWCVDTARNWPNERINCDIQLGIEQNQASIALMYDRKSTPLAPNEHVNTPSGWAFVEIAVMHVENASSMRYTPNGLLQTIAGDVSIGFTLKRNSVFYQHVFIMPLYACQILIILSFLLRGYRRGAVILIVLLVTAWGLMYLTRYASPHYVPPLMSVYQHIMRICIFCYLLHITTMWLERYPPRAKAPGLLLTVNNSSVLRFLLGLRFSDSADFSDIEQHPWRHLSKLLNSGCLVCVAVVFLVLNLNFA